MWKSAPLHSLLPNSVLSGTIFFSTVSFLIKNVFPSFLPSLILHWVFKDTHNQAVPAFCLTGFFFSVELYQKKSPHFFPQTSHWQVRRLGCILFRPGSSCTGKIKRSPAITQECDMQGIYLKTLYSRRTAHIHAVFMLSWMGCTISRASPFMASAKAPLTNKNSHRSGSCPGFEDCKLFWVKVKVNVFYGWHECVSFKAVKFWKSLRNPFPEVNRTKLSCWASE